MECIHKYTVKSTKHCLTSTSLYSPKRSQLQGALTSILPPAFFSVMPSQTKYIESAFTDVSQDLNTGGSLRGCTSHKATILMVFAFKLPNTAEG